MSKLYEADIEIECRPYSGFRNKWKAEARIRRPYHGCGYGENVICCGKTAEEATERLKDKLCKITDEEEREHATHLEWKAGIKKTTFNRDQDCCSVKPRPKLFSEHT
jgi:hypothetical protein